MFRCLSDVGRLVMSIIIFREVIYGVGVVTTAVAGSSKGLTQLFGEISAR